MGCAPKLQTAEDEPITAAWLEYFDLSSIAMLGGVVDGDAFLGYTTTSGEQRSMPVHLGGPVVGLAFDMTSTRVGTVLAARLHGGEVDPVMLSDALGTFHGSTASFVMGFGIDTRELKNRHGIKFQEDHLAFGMGIMAGFQWVRIREGGSEQGEGDGIFDDTSTPPDDSGDDSGGTDDTAFADDTGGADDTGARRRHGSGDRRHRRRHRERRGLRKRSGAAATPQQKDGCGCDDGGGSTKTTRAAAATALLLRRLEQRVHRGVWLLLGGRGGAAGADSHPGEQACIDSAIDAASSETGRPCPGSTRRNE
jgi:hypothetical protein